MKHYGRIINIGSSLPPWPKSADRLLTDAERAQMDSNWLAKERVEIGVEHYNPRLLPVPIIEVDHYRMTNGSASMQVLSMWLYVNPDRYDQVNRWTKLAID